MIDSGEVDGGEVGDNKVGKKVQNLSKSKKTVRLDFLILGAKLAFNELKQTFVKAPIFYYFNPEHYIRIEIDVPGYTIGGVFCQLILNNLGEWHLVVFFSYKMILVKTRYKTYNGELLAIVEVFKTWKHYLESS